MLPEPERLQTETQNSDSKTVGSHAQSHLTSLEIVTQTGKGIFDLQLVTRVAGSRLLTYSNGVLLVDSTTTSAETDSGPARGPGLG